MHRQIKCMVYPQQDVQISNKDKGLNGMSVVLLPSFRTLHCFSLTLLRSSSLVVKTATLRVFLSHGIVFFLFVTCELAYSRLVEDDGFSTRYLTGWEPPMEKCADVQWPETALMIDHDSQIFTNIHS